MKTTAPNTRPPAAPAWTRHEHLRFHRSPLRTETVVQVPAMAGVLLFTCGRVDRPNWEHFRDEALRRSPGRPPWVRVWPGAGVVVFGLPPVPIALARFQSSAVSIDPDGHLGQSFDPAWRTELGFEAGLGDRHLPWRHPADLVAGPAEPQSCFCHGDGDACAHFTFSRCHQVWLVADWAGGRDFSVVGCEYCLGLEAPC